MGVFGDFLGPGRVWENIWVGAGNLDLGPYLANIWDLGAGLGLEFEERRGGEGGVGRMLEFGAKSDQSCKLTLFREKSGFLVRF